MTNPCSAFSSGSLCSGEASGRMSRGRAAGSPSSERRSPEGVASDGRGSVASDGRGSAGSDGQGSVGSLRCSPYSPFSGDGRIPAPVRLDIDTDFQAVRQQEKEDIKVLNNQFVTLIEKVQSLEQQNKILTTRWNFLKDQDNSHSDSDIKAIYEQYMSKMNQEMKELNYEQENLESELAKVLSTMDTFRSKYEDEIRLCSGMEFTFMELKKDLDVSTLHRTELEVKLKGLQELLELKKTIYEQELEELLTEIKDISVVLGIDSCSRPDLGRIVEDVRAQYEALALRSWEEAEALTRRKLTDSSSQPGSFGGHLLDGRREIADLNIRIQKLRSCIVSQKSQVCPGGAHPRGRRAGRGHAPGCQGQGGRAGGGTAAQPRAHGSPGAGVPGAHEHQTGPGRGDPHLQEVQLGSMGSPPGSSIAVPTSPAPTPSWDSRSVER